MNLFQTLNSDGKIIVMDWIKSQMATPRQKKSIAPSVEKKSSRRGAGTPSTVSFEAGVRNATGASKLPDDPDEFKFAAGV